MMIKIPHHVLRAYDIRGKYPSEVNETLAKAIGQLIPQIVKSKEFCTGSDSRESSPSLLKALINGFLESGVRVFNLGEVPNPLIYAYCWKRRNYGVYVTASHNPYMYNGFKFVKFDGTSMLEEYYELKRRLVQGHIIRSVSKVKGGVVEVDGISEYLDVISKVVSDVSDVSIVIETFGGVVNRVLPKIAKEFGLKVKILHHEIRRDFYGLRPEPTKENLKLLAEEVVKHNAVLGVAFDGDADRSVFVDDKGNILDGSSAGILLVSHLVRKGDKVVITPDTSSTLEKFIKDKGAKVVISRIGHVFIEKKVLEEKAVLGIEQSSHFYHGYIYPFSDGLLSMLKLCEFAKEIRPSEILSKIPLRPIIKYYVDVSSDEIKWKIMDKVRSMFKNALVLADGIKYYFDNGWVLIRASQTMPEINICIEAPSEKDLAKLRKEYTNLILRLKREVMS